MKKQHSICTIIFLAGLCVFVFGIGASCIAGELYAGTAKADITPVDGTYPIHDPLHMRTLVLEADGTRIAFIAADLSSRSYVNRDFLEVAKERFGIEHLLTCDSHSHSTYSRGGPDSENGKRVRNIAVAGLEEAVKNRFPARISAGSQEFPQISYNRLIPREDGHSRGMWVGDEHHLPMNPDRIPYGPVDRKVSIIKIEDIDGNARAIMMNFACHPDIVAQSYIVSADYPGVACRKVEEEFEDAVCLFVQGAAGNIAPLFISPRRKNANDPNQPDYSQIEKMGGHLSYAAIKLAKSLKPEGDDENEIKAMHDSMMFTGRFNKTLEFDVHITTILINDTIAIAAFPGEPFHYFERTWKEQADAENPFFFGYTASKNNSWPGYVPDVRSAALGGFGADTKQNGIEIGAGERTMTKHLENLYRLKGLMRDKPRPYTSVTS